MTSEQNQVCEQTGLSLVRAPTAPTWRIAKTSYGPLKPRKRQQSDDRRGWNRYDVLDHRTVYSARPAEASYAEALAVLRPRLGTKLGDLFDESRRKSKRALLAEVEDEWRERDHMPPGGVPASWRVDRLLFQLTLDPKAWFVDVENSASVTVIRDALESSWATLGLTEFTVANLEGEDRAVTTAVADWLWHQTLDDGSLPAGIRYRSKHGADWECWAIWLRRTDDGKPGSEPTVVSAGKEITPATQNAPLKHVADLFDMICH